MPAPPLLGWTLAAGIRPGPDEARSWLERELEKPDYQQSLLQRFSTWLEEAWDRLSGTALTATPLSTGVALVIAVVVATLLVLAASRLRRDPATGTSGDGLLPGVATTPEGHRAAAEAALGSGDAATALVEAFRALAVRAVRRGLVDPRPGITAHELVTDLGPRFPDHADRLSGAADRFDATFYGRQPVGVADARAVLDLDDALRAARPSPLPGQAVSP